MVIVFFENLPMAFWLVFGGLMVVLGMVLSTVGVMTLRQWLASASWEKVAARIITSGVREVRCFEDQILYRPEVTYLFSSGGGEVTGSRLGVSGKMYRTQQGALKAVERYPVGMIVSARFDPDDPTQSILERSSLFPILFLLAMGGAMILAPFILARRAGLPVHWGALVLFLSAAVAAAAVWWPKWRLSRARGAGLHPPPGKGSDADVERLLRHGEKMLAIRLYREIYAVDLKTSRLRVEELQARLRNR